MAGKRLTRFAFSERMRLLRFGLVGVSGVAVNEGLTWLGHELLFAAILGRLRVNLAAALGIAVSVFTNFLLNDLWTWGDRVKGTRRHWLYRLGKYYVAAGIGVVIQLAVLNALVEIFGGRLYLLWNLAGIGLGMVSNFVLMHFWAFRSVEGPGEAVESVEPGPAAVSEGGRRSPAGRGRPGYGS